MASFTIKSYIASDGERFSQLYRADLGGFPLYYPTAFILRMVRVKCTHATQKVYLEALKRVCEWELRQNVDLATRFHRKEFLLPREIDSLTLHLGERRDGEKGDVISRSKHNTNIAYAAAYLRWLAEEVISDTNILEVRVAINRQHDELSNRIVRKTGSKSAHNQSLVATRLPEAARSTLLALFNNPFAGLHRAADKGSRLRNVVMLRVLYETGMRRGELLSLKISDHIVSGGGEAAFLRIQRNHHDKLDSRVQQPVAKTLGRIVPISDAAERQLLDYIENWRADIPGVGFSDQDFLFVNHRAGRAQGQPIAETTFSSALSILKESFINLCQLHPHLLRHDWNYRFSEKVDEENWDFETERTVRECLMGWRNNSPMSLLYNQRHIQEQANTIGLKIATDTIRSEGIDA